MFSPKQEIINNRVIFTVQHESEHAGLNEIIEADKGSKLLKWLEPGVGLVELASSFFDLSKTLQEQCPIFVQHICPVNVKITPSDNVSEIAELLANIKNNIDLLSKNKSFSVQTRIITAKKIEYKEFNINQPIADELIKLNFKLDVRNPQQIISIVYTGADIYLGFSRATENLSDWAGGKHRLARDANQISRAEFKLIEAIKVFNLTLPKSGTALDLGAAPGGWTKVLRDLNLKVIAVDPAQLHESLKKDPGVIYYSQSAQEFLKKNKKVDLIVNDMKMDPVNSAQLMVEAQSGLKPDGIAIITLKLPKKGQLKCIRDSVKVLGQAYRVERVKQLFHNRCEVTVLLRKESK